jgi:hypothetical protein
MVVHALPLDCGPNNYRSNLSGKSRPVESSQPPGSFRNADLLNDRYLLFWPGQPHCQVHT